MPTKPKAYARNGVMADDLIDFNSDLHNQALQLTEGYKMGPIFTPPVISTSTQRGTLTVGTSFGATNWPGGSYDPETHIFYVQACNLCMRIIGLFKPKPGATDMDYVEGIGGRLSSLDVQGLPIMKPPYGTITAINMDTGEFVWQVPHGETPDAIRNNPLLNGLTIPRTGQEGHVGTLITKTLVICGDPIDTTNGSRGRGAMLRAYDKATGREVGAVYMPAPQTGSPMTYILDGRQYIVLAIGGENFSSEYIAFRLPRN
jgi:quinoprotein glucose dehydrogenase